MKICTPFYKIMDSSNYIMHANDLRAAWQYSAKIRIDKTKNDHGHSPSNLASPVAARQERCRKREWRAGRARKKKIQRLDICQAAPARLPRFTRPAVKRLLLRSLSLLVRWCRIKFGDSISRSVRLDDTEGRAARQHNGRHCVVCICTNTYIYMYIYLFICIESYTP